MRPISTRVVFLSLTALTAAAPLTSEPASYTTRPTATTAPAWTQTFSANNACATVSELVVSASSAVPTIPAQIAWECLQSVPLNATAAVPWLESLKPYVNWQTTLAYLKNPPAGYLEPAVDFWGEINGMISNLQQGGSDYCNEYALENALFQLFNQCHDGHFSYFPTLTCGIFEFGRPLALVSVSSDGQSLPKPYVYTDILLSTTNPAFVASAVARIDGQDAVSYLENLSQYVALQDPDALYNILFYELAQISLGTTGAAGGIFAGGGTGAFLYPGPTTTLTFENGTSRVYENFARVLQPFTNVTKGQDIYDKYLAPTSTTTRAFTPPASTPTPAPGYPAPVMRQANNLIGGYYLEGAAYADVAVLSVPSFDTIGSAVGTAFQSVALTFLAQSKANGKTKVIVDLSANGGGTVFQGYSLFKNLFPELDPYGGTRFRAHQAVKIIGEEVSAVLAPTFPEQNVFTDAPFDYRNDRNISGQNFTSWKVKYGPHEYYNDNFTSIIRYNLSLASVFEGITVNGYGSRTGIVKPSQTFGAENIVLLYDGYCASTCAIFSELMTSQGGVKTIAVGGRPSYGPMQAVGGTKGANNYAFEELIILANATFELGTKAQDTAWENTELGQYSPLALNRALGVGGSLNVRDNIAPNDTTNTPLQFVYQKADCRIFYTPEMTVDVTALWETVADTAWGGKSACVMPQAQSGRKERSLGTRAAKMSVSPAELELLHASLDTWTDRRGRKIVADGYVWP